MSAKPTALDASGLIRPTRPSAEDEAQIVQDLGLSEIQAHELKLVIDHFVTDVGAYLDHLARIAPRLERARRLRRIEKAFRRLQYEVEKSGDLLDDCLPFALSQNLGAKLTFAAIGNAIGEKVSPRQFDYVMQKLVERETRISMQVIEGAFEAERQALGLAHAGAVFRSVINDLYEPLGQWVNLDKKPPGRKSKRFRNLLVERLAEASRDILGRTATGTANGRFVRFCARVLDAMEISSEGVENAVGAILKARKEKAESEKVSRGR